MTSQEKIESFFNMPLHQVIQVFHWKQNKSIKWISDQTNISRKTISKICKINSIKTRSHQEATSITKNKGENHWAYGLNKENSIIHKKNSERMQVNNPSSNLDIRTKAAFKRAEYFKNNPLPQELIFRYILNDLNIEYIYQCPIGPYVIDFFILEKKLCIEIDSSNKWSKEKKKTAINKDIFLKSLDLKILRINKDKLSKNDLILKILNSHNLI